MNLRPTLNFRKLTHGLIAAAAVCAAFFTATVARAASDSVVLTEHARSEILMERDGLAPGKTTWFAFSQDLEDGWHVYWKNPGDSGLPLTLDWSLPDGFSAGEIIYPVPEQVPVGPLANFGHHGSPAFLVPVTAPANAQPGDVLEISIDAAWLICADVCVPEDGSFTIDTIVAASPQQNENAVELFTAARERASSALEVEAIFTARDDGLTLMADWPIAQEPANVFFFPNMEGLIEPAAPQAVRFEEGRLTVTMQPGYLYDPAKLEMIAGVFAFDGKENRTGYSLIAKPGDAAAAIASSAQVGPPTSGGSAIWRGPSIPVLMLMAFFGGVILNAMPCVFPIIFIKAASLMKAAHEDRKAMRHDGLMFTAGVVATFVLIAVILIALRAGGAQLGWGFHLQSPLVVALSAYILFLVGLNLAGVFEIGENLQGVGSGLASKSGVAGSFFTGALAVVVAAPCVGPLLSAPIGAALMAPPIIGLSIFIMMALGLAAPYLAVSSSPALARALPKPGAWMVVMKQALAFPVFAAAAYFLWVLTSQTGTPGLARALFGALMLAVAAWLFQLSKGERPRDLIIRAGSALALILGVAPVLNLTPVDIRQASAEVEAHGALPAEPYDLDQIAAYNASGAGVFVDFTAKWCITCQFNKITLFSKKSLAGAFDEANVKIMVADWTMRDPEITAALESFGAAGVPLYVYYPTNGAPEVFGQPLTEAAIRKKLDAAASQTLASGE